MLPEFPSASAAARRRRESDRKVSELASSKNVLRGGTIEDGDLTLLNDGGVISKGSDGAVFTMRGGRIGFQDQPDSPGGGLYVESAPGYGDYIYLFPPIDSTTSQTWLRMQSYGEAVLSADGDVTLSANGDVILSPASGHNIQIFSLTSVSTGNHLVWNLVGGVPVIQYIPATSSMRFKQDVEDLTVDPEAVLALTPITWRYTEDVEAATDTAVRHVGYSAEQVHDLGLTEFVGYDDEGQPNMVNYDRLAVAQQIVLRKQAAQIDDLLERLTALESRETA